MNLKRVVTKMRETFVAHGLIENLADPIPLTMRGHLALSASNKVLPLDPRNIFPCDAYIRIISVLKSNCSLRELHLPCSLGEEGSLKLIAKTLLETASCNTSLTEVKVHSDGKTSFFRKASNHRIFQDIGK